MSDKDTNRLLGRIADALERLTAPDQMGRLFKVATMVTGALSIQTPRKTR